MNDKLLSGYSRNSFDRFGDDLCEHIVQYLSFEDKIRFECVSRQFKRCVYQRQYELESHTHKVNNAFNFLPIKKLFDCLQQNEANDEPNAIINNFERVLKKCKRIKRLIIENRVMFMSFDSLLRVITDNCNDLKAITVYNVCGNGVSMNTLKDFGAKFGKTLQRYNFEFWNSDALYLIKLCPNIVSINDIDVHELVNYEITLPKLREVINLKGCDDIDSMDRFTSKFRNTIKVFETSYRGSNFVQFMSQISQLNQLESLSLCMTYRYYHLDSPDFVNSLRRLSYNCRLKHFRVEFRHHTNFTELLNSINCFTELKSLRLLGVRNNTTESVELIKDCRQLTRLEVGNFIDDRFFKDIGTYLSLLTIVKIHTQCPNYRVTCDILDCLALLEHLSVCEMINQKYMHLRKFEVISKTFRLRKIPPIVYPQSICNVLENCAHFRSFRFVYCPLITEQTMQEVIGIAISRPHINFSHDLGICEPNEFNIISTAINTYGLPLNLKILFNIDNDDVN